MSGVTPSQTIGPFFRPALEFAGGGQVAEPGSQGRRIALEGVVRDGAGNPVDDALLETWQANAFGRYRHPDDARFGPADEGFDGFGRVATATDGSFALQTILPGGTPGPEGRAQAPHLVLGLFARGVLTRLITRVYFEGEPGNESDPILALVPAPRRATLIARAVAPDRYRFDIALQGEHETVFFDV